MTPPAFYGGVLGTSHTTDPVEIDMDYRCPHCGVWLHHPDSDAVRDTANVLAVSTDCPKCRQVYEITMTEFGYYQVRRTDQVNDDHPDKWSSPKFKRPHWARGPETGEAEKTKALPPSTEPSSNP